MTRTDLWPLLQHYVPHVNDFITNITSFIINYRAQSIQRTTRSHHRAIKQRRIQITVRIY